MRSDRRWKSSYHSRMHASSLLLVLPLLFSFLARVYPQQVHTSIKNRLGNGRNLTLHCQSADNDLGQQNVTDGSEFRWDFAVNVGGTTLFFCDMGWEEVGEYHIDAYNFQRDFSRCPSNCSWVVAAEGMYNLNEGTGLWEFA